MNTRSNARIYFPFRNSEMQRRVQRIHGVVLSFVPARY
jgi:hypothetical protein